MTAQTTDPALAGWPSELVGELEASRTNGRVGHKLVSETDEVRVWHISLAPGERIGFHCHVLNYFWTATTDGVSTSRYADGRMLERVYNAGDTRHFAFSHGEFMLHDLHNIGTTPLQFVTVEFKNSPNRPLPI